MEYVVLNILLLLVFALLFAAMGAALAGGAWVVWRSLERRARHTLDADLRAAPRNNP